MCHQKWKHLSSPADSGLGPVIQARLAAGLSAMRIHERHGASSGEIDLKWSPMISSMSCGGGGGLQDSSYFA